MELADQLKSLSHHAYALIGRALLRAELLALLEEEHSIQIQGNPDMYDRSFETFTIDDARELKSAHETRPVTEAGKKIFILSMNAVTVEAQNALLKLFEEPSEYAHFFVIIPSAHLLLPTVKSRIRIIEDRSRSKGKGSMEAEAFVSTSVPGRLEIVKALLDDISKEKKTKQDAIEFLDAVQRSIYKNDGPVKGNAALRAIESARRYIDDRAPSLKMLLESVALNI